MPASGFVPTETDKKGNQENEEDYEEGEGCEGPRTLRKAMILEQLLEEEFAA